tara:strand:+ start:125 stop:472 length:348 start_codon:yes stop_codon:yes gene_type:complete
MNLQKGNNMPRMTKRYISFDSDEFTEIKAQVKAQVKDQLTYEDMFRIFKDIGCVTLIETMDKDKTVVGFTFPSQRLGIRQPVNSYSLITHNYKKASSDEVAVRWVKSEAKKEGNK